MTVRSITAWTLYRLGSAWCSVAVVRGLGNWCGWPYRVYNALMVRSAKVQGDGPDGPWMPVIR